MPIGGQHTHTQWQVNPKDAGQQNTPQKRTVCPPVGGLLSQTAVKDEQSLRRDHGNGGITVKVTNARKLCTYRQVRWSDTVCALAQLKNRAHVCIHTQKHTTAGCTRASIAPIHMP